MSSRAICPNSEDSEKSVIVLSVSILSAVCIRKRACEKSLRTCDFVVAISDLLRNQSNLSGLMRKRYTVVYPIVKRKRKQFDNGLITFGGEFPVNEKDEWLKVQLLFKVSFVTDR